MRRLNLAILSSAAFLAPVFVGSSPDHGAAEIARSQACPGTFCMRTASPPDELANDQAPDSPIPQEPEEYDPREVKAFYDWRNDLFFRHFDMGGTGRTDYMTARRTYQVWLSEFGDPVVLTMAYPLFYWVDTDADGEFEPSAGEMWSDPEEDGLNGNEQPYDVSGVSSAGPPPYPY